MAKIFLKHLRKNEVPAQLFYFYDGQTVVRYGVIELPADNTTWIKRAVNEGFRLDPDTDELLDYYQIVARAESAMSAGDNVEGTNLGGQPAGEDGLRESELPRDAGVPASGVGSRGRPRTANRKASN
jgi:hypothetical protein